MSSADEKSAPAPATQQDASAPSRLGNHEDVSAISLSMRIPPVWHQRLRLWFAQFEAIMKPLRQGDQAMFDIVIRQLDKQDLDIVDHLILKPPETNKYEALKTKLLAFYEDSDERRLDRLLAETELGDLKPSQLLRRMQHLAGDGMTDHTVRNLWMRHLPPSVRAVLAVTSTIATTADIDELAKMADKIMESTQMSHNSAAVGTSIAAVDAHKSAPASSNQDINEKLEFLMREIAELKTQKWQNSQQHYNNWSRDREPQHTRQRSRSRPRIPRPQPAAAASDDSRAPVTGSLNSGICYYHRRFGSKAIKCTRPCNFEEKPEN